MKKSNAPAVATQGVQTVNPSLSDMAGMFEAFKQFMALQQAPTQPAPVVPVSVPVSVVDGKPKGASKKSAPVKSEPVKPAAPVAVSVKGAHIFELGKSFFVYGEGAPAKLADFLKRKPHLDRGFKNQVLEGVGCVSAMWFGGRQLEKVKKELAK